MQPVLPNLYISSWYTITGGSILEDHGITHIISVMTEVVDSALLNKYKRMIISVNDDPDELLIDYFEAAAQWIDDALADNGKVLVHCVAGRSRSATIMAAYLMQRFNIGVEEALQKIEVVRNVDPNSGFREQLQVYLDCNYVPNSTKAAYRHWRLQKEAEMQKGTSPIAPGVMKGAAGKYGKPDVVYYASAEAVTDDRSGSPVVDLRCKMCRRVLASSASFLIHKPPEEKPDHSSTYAQVASTPRAKVDSVLPSLCAHFFLEPQDWMQSTIDQGELEGKFECPKCSAKVGGYAWQGMKCSCGKWITPCFSLGKSKVDEVRRVSFTSTARITRPKFLEDTVKSKA